MATSNGNKTSNISNLANITNNEIKSSPSPPKRSLSNNLESESGTEILKKKLLELENLNKELNDQCSKKQEKIVNLECELMAMSKFKDAESRVDAYKIKLNVLQDKNVSLQESLSAETRFKMDLFSALGEARRQLEYSNCNILKIVFLQFSFS